MTHQIIVTTSRRSTVELREQAEQWSKRLGVAFVERSGSLERLCQDNTAQGVLTVTDRRVSYHEPDSGLEYFFHPSMAKVRIHNLQVGRGDPMVTAMALQAGDSLLDCTVGRASDAVVAAHVVGTEGSVLGLEKVPVIAQLTIHGLATYQDSSARLTGLLRRIRVLQADYLDYLRQCPDAAFDVVYFDPVFHEPLEKSQAMAPLRKLADKQSVTPEALEEAIRVCRRRVVIKQRYDTPLWAQLGITRTTKGGSSRIEYGIVEP